MGKAKGLLDAAADSMGCHYLSDLRYLSPYQRCILAAYIETHDMERYALFEWNDALEYLCGEPPQASIIAARDALLKALRSVKQALDFC